MRLRTRPLENGRSATPRPAARSASWANGSPRSYDEALRYFDRSIDADPMFIYAYLSQGAIHNEREAHDNAIAKYQLATEINPSAQIFTRAGAYLRKYERHADSIPMFQKAADLKPSANAYTYWGMALRDSGTARRGERAL